MIANYGFEDRVGDGSSPLIRKCKSTPLVKL